MKKFNWLIFVAAFASITSCKNGNNGTATFTKFDDAANTFDKSYPKSLILPDGSTVQRVDEILLLRFDSVPSLASLAIDVKQAEFSLFAGDSLAKRVNNSKHHVWIGKSGTVSQFKLEFDKILASLKGMGHAANWITPVYRIDSLKGNTGLFAPLPRTIIIRTDLLSDDLKSEFTRIGLVLSPRTLPDYSFFSLSDNSPYSAMTISDYLRKMPQFLQEGAYYFENAPFVKPIFDDPIDRFWSDQRDQMALIQVPAAWNLAGPNLVKVAVIDYGCNTDYGDLKYMNPGRRADDPNIPGVPADMVDVDHGTSVAALIGALHNNLGIAGVGMNVSIYPVALVDGTDVEVASAIKAASDQRVDIINMSIGAYSWKCSVLDPMINYAYNKGILMCAASGNDGFDNWMAFPAINPKVMAIGGSDSDSHYEGSNYGDVLYKAAYKTGISVVAPAKGCTTVNFAGMRASLSGTSASCPFVVGVAALIKSAHPTFTHLQIRNIIESSTDQVGAGEGDGYRTVRGYPNGPRFGPMGYGRVNALKAMRKAAPVVGADLSQLLFPH